MRTVSCQTSSMVIRIILIAIFLRYKWKGIKGSKEHNEQICSIENARGDYSKFSGHQGVPVPHTRHPRDLVSTLFQEVV